MPAGVDCGPKGATWPSLNPLDHGRLAWHALSVLAATMLGERRSSFHEAGHVLAAMRWVGGVVSATIVPDAKGSAGHVECRSEGDAISIDGLVSFIMAGYAGERVRGYREHNDIRAIRSLRAVRHPGDFLIDGVMTEDVAVALRTLRTHQPTVYGPSAILSAYQRAVAFLKCHRELLLTIADALVSERTVPGARLYALVEGRLPRLHSNRP